LAKAAVADIPYYHEILSPLFLLGHKEIQDQPNLGRPIYRQWKALRLRLPTPMPSTGLVVLSTRKADDDICAQTLQFLIVCRCLNSELLQVNQPTRLG
jgi:hypothetical protein